MRFRIVFKGIGVSVLAFAIAHSAYAQKQEIEIKAPDGVALKATYYSPEKPGPGVMLFHMCNRDRSSWDAFAQQLVSRGVHVLAWDYRGFGQSGGEQVPRMPLAEVVQVWRKSWGADMRAVHNWFVAQPGVDESRMAAAGGSCGVFMSLLYAESFAPHVKAAVILAGPSEARLRDFVARTESFAVLGGVSKEETGPAQMIQEVVSASKNPHSKMLRLENAGHGTDMLAKDADLSTTVVTWLVERLAVPQTPLALNKPTLTYMADKKFAVLFGGYSRTRAIAETWLLQNNCWRKLDIPGPAARVAHAAAYDEKRRKVVLFGGGSSEKAFGDTWEFDGERWEQKAVAGPEPRVVHRMAYDAKRGRVVLHGGSDGQRGGIRYGDMWEWDGKAWSKLSEGGAPPRAEHAFAYDAKRNAMVAYGGYNSDGKRGDTWLYSRNAWTEVAAGNGPPGRDHHAMAYHAARGVTVLFAGTGLQGAFVGDTWTWDGKKWTEQDAAGAPTARGGTPAITYDPHRKKILLYGGWAQSGPQRDLWEWDGAWMRVQEEPRVCTESAKK